MSPLLNSTVSRHRYNNEMGNQMQCSATKQDAIHYVRLEEHRVEGSAEQYPTRQ